MVPCALVFITQGMVRYQYHMEQYQYHMVQYRRPCINLKHFIKFTTKACWISGYMVQYQYHMVQYQYQVGVLASNLNILLNSQQRHAGSLDVAFKHAGFPHPSRR